MKYIAQTLHGLEHILAEEIKTLGGENVVPLKRAVQFEGDLEMLYRVNYQCYTVLRVLQPIATFNAKHEKVLYRKIRQIEWKEYMSVKDTFAIRATTASEYMKHSKYISLVAKDGIADYFRQVSGDRPNVDIKHPSLWIQLHVTNDECTVSLNSSGAPLFKRGYRSETLGAPINELLAAGMIKLSGWDYQSTFLDPMCGSGTIAIEAALQAYRIPPQRQRKEFGFQRWANYDKALFEQIKKEAAAQVLKEGPKIYAADQDFRAIKMVGANLFGAELTHEVSTYRKPFEKAAPPDEAGILITNPPYDERLGVRNIEEFYKGIGDKLKTDYTGWNAWIISSNMSALKQVGLRPSRKITLFNGKLECKFQKYELYAGTKKIHKQRVE